MPCFAVPDNGPALHADEVDRLTLNQKVVFLPGVPVRVVPLEFPVAVPVVEEVDLGLLLGTLECLVEAGLAGLRQIDDATERAIDVRDGAAASGATSRKPRLPRALQALRQHTTRRLFRLQNVKAQLFRQLSPARLASVVEFPVAVRANRRGVIGGIGAAVG